jgi:hypothetical protein
MDFLWIWYFRIILKICWENSSFLNMWQEQRVHYIKTKIYLLLYLPEFFLEWEMFQTKLQKKSKHLRFNNFSSENCAVCEVMWKKIWYSQAGHIWQSNTEHTLCLLDN